MRKKASFLYERNCDDHRADSTRRDDQRGTIRELLLLNLFVVFSERDPDRRLKAIVANYTEDVVWSDSDATTHGRED